MVYSQKYTTRNCAKKFYNEKLNKSFNRFPWMDNELLTARRVRDKAYVHAISTKLPNDWNKYKQLRYHHNKLNRCKQTVYFEQKTTSDFKTPKAFWEFYSTSIKIKYDNSELSNISTMKFDGQNFTDSLGISNSFNKFFTN